MIEDQYCPVTGLRVFTRPEWTNKKVSDTFIANFYIIGNFIIYSLPKGKADLEGVRNSTALKEEIARLVSGGAGPYIQIQDYAFLHGSTQAARNCFIKNAVEDRRLLSLIFCNLSHPLSIAVKIGNRFNTTGKNIYAVKHYIDAVQQALKLYSGQNLTPDFIAPDRIGFDTGNRSLTPLHVMSDNAWNIQTPEFSNRTVLLDRCILHSTSDGYLEPEHIPLVDRMRHMCRSALANKSGIEYIVVDSSRVKGGSRAARLKYMQSLKDWHRQFPFRMYIAYGANTFTRTAVQLARPLMPFKVKIAKDVNDAFESIRRDRPGDSERKTRREKGKRSDPNLENIEKLLAFIASINWEQEGIAVDFELDETHPFSILFLSLKLIKEELDSLFADRKKAAEALQDSYVQLQTALSELKQTQEKMVQQERLAAVGQLAAGIAHDFNNILTSILGFAELLQLSPDTPPAIQSDLEKITVSGLRAAYLVRQLLDFSRKTIRHPRQIELSSFTRESAKFFQRIIPEHIRIHLKMEPCEYLTEADPTQLQQVLTNLVINARDAMPSGGRLEISLSRRKTEGKETCAICGQPILGEWIRLTVADSGAGITPDVLPHIFEPFFTTKEVGEGTGLGLSQVYGIISQHAGHITVNTRAGYGTTITTYLLPAASQREKTADEPPSIVSQGHGQTILLVEDEPAVLKAGQMMLEYLGYRVVTAVNGREALSVYRGRQSEIALVLSDMVMPDMAGEALFYTLKAENPDIKMVMMSGYPLNEKGAELLQHGVVAWFEKPVSIGKLSHIVGQALSNGKQL